jgi:hypothetical protein
MSGSGRAGVFDDNDDLGDFRPKPRPEAVRGVAEQAGFRSREPGLPAPPEGALVQEPPSRREVRRYRTGRNQQLNLKVRAEDAEAFYALADQHGWVLGETFARAVAALQREVSDAAS